jgi:hypothetical protein
MLSVERPRAMSDCGEGGSGTAGRSFALPHVRHMSLQPINVQARLHPTTRRIAQEGCEDGTGIGKSPPTSTLLVAWKYRNTSLCDAYYSHSREGSKGIPPRDSCGHLLVPEVMAKNIHTYVCVKHLQIACLFREHHFSEHVSTCKWRTQQ